jgi:signal transduction histidine kinase
MLLYFPQLVTENLLICFSLCNSSLVLEKSEFSLGDVMNVVVSQTMSLLRERDLQLIRDIPDEIKDASAYGDQFRIQQVLADFLLSMAQSAPSENGWVEIQVRPNVKQNYDGTDTELFIFRLAACSFSIIICHKIFFFVYSRNMCCLILVEDK